MAVKQEPWEQTAAAKRAAQLNSIPEVWRLSAAYLEKAVNDPDGVMKVPVQCGLLSDQELDITENYDVVGLSEKLQSGSLSAKAVVSAFCKRAAIAHQLVGSIKGTKS